MYQQLIKRKLAYLIQASDTSIINSPTISKSYQRFDDNKRKEIIVWIRQLKGKDKHQIKDDIIHKFNVSEEDAEKLYYEAYPEGLSSQEEELVQCFEDLLPKDNPQDLLDDTIVIIFQEETPHLTDKYDIDEDTSQLFIDFIQSMLQSRKLIPEDLNLS